MPDPLPPPLPPAAGNPGELTAQGKYTCPMCGGEAHWNAAKQALVCIYCGAETPAKIADASTGRIEEHDLAAALRGVPDEARGYGAETHSVRCTACGAVTVFPAGRVSQRCDFCGATALVPYEQTRAPIRPESLLAFRIAEAQARDAAREWYRTRWFAPNALRSGAFTDQLRGFYLPYWTFDAQATCPWRAEAGFYYYEEESYQDNDGKTQTRRVQRTQWQPASGTVEHFFDDILVPASRGAPPALLAALEPFPTTTEALTAYDPSFLAGWLVEQYQLDLPAAVGRADERMAAELRAMCSREVPGDTQRNLQIYPQFSGRTFKHLLLPVWVVSYRYGGQVYPLLVNGHTGTLAGNYPKSWVKITLLVMLILIALAVVLSLSQHVHSR